jgi:hypothetical protein
MYDHARESVYISVIRDFVRCATFSSLMFTQFLMVWFFLPHVRGRCWRHPKQIIFPYYPIHQQIRCWCANKSTLSWFDGLLLLDNKIILTAAMDISSVLLSSLTWYALPVVYIISKYVLVTVLNYAIRAAAQNQKVNENAAGWFYRLIWHQHLVSFFFVWFGLLETFWLLWSCVCVK